MSSLRPSQTSNSVSCRFPCAPRLPSQWASNLSLDANYWGANLRQPVLLKNAIEAMAKDGVQVFMEIGAHPSFSG